MPFVSAAMFFGTMFGLLGFHAIRRTYFATKKVDYDFYGEEAKAGHHEMTGGVIEEQEVNDDMV